MAKTLSLIVFFIFIMVTSCKERFEPNLPSLKDRYLIVEGFINTGNGPTRIVLSRSTPIDEPKNFTPETNAIVHVEGDDNSSFMLNNMMSGEYVGDQLPLNNAVKYRIRIKTADGKDYVSSYVPVKTTPDIDSISWKEENGGVMIYANTHDSNNNTWYYKWDYDETWEIQSAFSASFRYIDGVVRPTIFGVDPDIYTCWRYGKSTSILLGSSAKLQSDVIHQNPLLFIPYMDERIGIRYSILVRQYAMDKEEFQFMSQMKKNTESLGTIFDPQPSAIRGNVKCENDPNEMVIGYVNATSVVEQRIFISAGQITGPRFRMDCTSDTVLVKDIMNAVPGSLPHTGIYEMGFLKSYLVSSPRCVDCRTRGSNVKPSYW